MNPILRKKLEAMANVVAEKGGDISVSGIAGNFPEIAGKMTYENLLEVSEMAKRITQIGIAAEIEKLIPEDGVFCVYERNERNWIPISSIGKTVKRVVPVMRDISLIAITEIDAMMVFYRRHIPDPAVAQKRFSIIGTYSMIFPGNMRFFRKDLSTGTISERICEDEAFKTERSAWGKTSSITGTKAEMVMGPKFKTKRIGKAEHDLINSIFNRIGD